MILYLGWAELEDVFFHPGFSILNVKRPRKIREVQHVGEKNLTASP